MGLRVVFLLQMPVWAQLYRRISILCSPDRLHVFRAILTAYGHTIPPIWTMRLKYSTAVMTKGVLRTCSVSISVRVRVMITLIE